MQYSLSISSKIILLLWLLLTFYACKNNNTHETAQNKAIVVKEKIAAANIFPKGQTIQTRFKTPPNYKRIVIDSMSFGAYLRNLPLKPVNSKVKYYDGSVKENRNIYAAVIDMEIGNRDLQQCADAVMRLRGEYLFAQKKYHQIHFNFLSDGKPRYFKTYAEGDYSYQKFRKYMNYIFAFANTASLLNELEKVPDISQIRIGDVFIQKGNPYGHAVIVVDVAENDNGEKIFMIAQSYMPAQETQILVNRENTEISPWYKAKKGTLETPEWTFDSTDLRRFKS